MAAGRHLVLATVACVNPGDVTYPACTACYTKLVKISEPEFSKLQCARCGKVYTDHETTHRYRLGLSVVDRIVCREITVFGSCLDAVFGIDATSLSRYLKHIEEHHLSRENMTDLLQGAVHATLTGLPFYFGFKSSCLPPTLRTKASVTTHVSLADVGAIDENLVALQIFPPSCKWNFPTVMQRFVLSVAKAVSPSGVMGEKAMGICEGDDACPLQLYRMSSDSNKLVGDAVMQEQQIHVVSRQSSVDDAAVLTSQQSVKSHSGMSHEDSSIAGLSISLSVPSLRLSCDRVSLLGSWRDSSQLHTNISTISESGCKCESDSGNQIMMPSMAVARQSKKDINSAGREAWDEGSVKAPVYNHDERMKVNLHNTENIPSCATDRVRDVSRTFSEHKGLLHGTPRATRDVPKCVNATVQCSAIHGHRSDAVPANAHDGSFEYDTNYWLEESSLDRWSFCEHTVETSKHLLMQSDNNFTSMSNNPAEEVSTANWTKYDFPEDLPFSEDLDQFLQDVEEEYALTKKFDPESLKDSCPCKQCDATVERQAKKCKKCVAMKCHRQNLSESESCQGTVAGDCVENSKSLSRKDSRKDIIARVHVMSEHRLLASHDGTRGEFSLQERECSTVNMCEHSPKRKDYPLICGMRNCSHVAVTEKEVHTVEKDRLTCMSPITDPSAAGTASNASERRDVVKRTGGEMPHLAQSTKEPTLCSPGEVNDYTDEIGDHEDDFNSSGFPGCSQSPVLFSQSQSPIASSPLPRHFSASDLVKIPVSGASSLRETKRFESHVSDTPRTCRANTSQEHCLKVQSSVQPSITGQCQMESFERNCHMQNKENKNKEGDCSFGGTPNLFSQVLSVENSSCNSPVLRGRLSKLTCKKRSIPLREVCLQKARAWKMSSTPRERKINACERMFDSPSVCGTPDLFSDGGSPVRTDGFDESLGKDEVCLDKSLFTDVEECFECTPDLF
ncbi:uncharacterized protein [Diadema setosum]|uniref:uncharacterized protein n=1 Tax=Diadema setosum TaxID=31175 RepID=UPI003B3A01BE